jgi:hypothetical protein
MIHGNIIGVIEKQDWLDTAADTLQPAIINDFKSAGDGRQKVKIFLNGTWVGHQLHQFLKDVMIGT